MIFTEEFEGVFDLSLDCCVSEYFTWCQIGEQQIRVDKSLVLYYVHAPFEDYVNVFAVFPISFDEHTFAEKGDDSRFAVHVESDLAVEQTEEVVALGEDPVDLVDLEEGEGFESGHALFQQIYIVKLDTLTYMRSTLSYLEKVFLTKTLRSAF